MGHGGVILFLSPEWSESLPQLGISETRLAQDTSAMWCRYGAGIQFPSAYKQMLTSGILIN